LNKLQIPTDLILQYHKDYARLLKTLSVDVEEHKLSLTLLQQAQFNQSLKSQMLGGLYDENKVVEI